VGRCRNAAICNGAVQVCVGGGGAEDEPKPYSLKPKV
jgi:hypothetical protein